MSTGEPPNEGTEARPAVEALPAIPIAGAPDQVLAGAGTADDRLVELEQENVRLRRIVADRDLELEMLREISRGTY